MSLHIYPAKYHTKEYFIEGLTVELNGIYYIFLRNHLVGKKALKVLAHELIHVQQYYTGRLKKVDKQNFEFEGRVYTKKLDIENNVWEAEAYNYQAKLVTKISKQLP